MPAETRYQSRAGGQRTAPMPVPSINGGGLAAIGRGIEQISGAVQDAQRVDDRIKLRVYQEGRQEDRDSQAADAARRFAELRLAMDEESRVLRNGAKDGGAGHVAAITERLTARKTALLDGLTEDNVRDQATAQFDQYQAALSIQEGDWQEGQRVGKLVRDTASVSSISANRVRNKPESYAEELKAGYDAWDAMDIAPEFRAKGRKAHGTEVTIAYGNALLEKNAAALKGMLASGVFEDVLEPEQIEQLNNAADVEMRRALAAAEHQADLQARADADEVSAIKTEIGAGVDIEPGRIATLLQRAEARGDKSQAAGLRVALVQSQTKRETDTWTPAQWDQAITTLEAVAKRTPEQDIRLEALRDGRGAATERFEKRPGEWAAGVGFAPPALDMGNPAAIADYGRWRKSVMASTNGRDPGFPPALVSEWQAKVKGAVPQRLDLLEDLQALPSDMRLAAVRTVAAGDPLLQHVAMQRSTLGRKLAMEGPALRTANPKLVNNDQASIAWSSHVGQSMNGAPGELAAGAKLAASNIYASLAQQNGWTVFNRRGYENAVEIALEQRVGSHKGHRVIVPRDMGQQGFDAKIAAWNATVPVSGSNGKPVDGAGKPVMIGFIKQNLVPRFVGGSRYMWVDPQDGTALMNERGQPWVVDIRQLPSKKMGQARKGAVNYDGIDFSAGRAGGDNRYADIDYSGGRAQ